LVSNLNKSQVLGDLLDQIPLEEQIDSVYTDGAYDTKYCRQVVSDRQARSIERNELLKTVKRLGRAI
jgi:hypothetical protein